MRNSIPFVSPFALGSAEYIRQVLDVICDPAWLRQESDSGLYEIRCPKVIRMGTLSGYYSNPDALARDAADLSGNVTTVYITLNPTDRRLLSRAENQFINYAEHTTKDEEIL